jgi:two-component system, chemotaxis family, sensor kinase Cph1
VKALDLSNCDQEPIHVPGAIQPHGALLACRSAPSSVPANAERAASGASAEPQGAAHGGHDEGGLPRLLVEHASANLLELLGVSSTSALGQDVESFFEHASAAALRQVAQHERPRDESPLRLVSLHGRPFDAVLHRSPEGCLVIELESPSGEVSFHPRLRRSLANLSSTERLSELWSVAAEEVRALSGFDRVMVYRFDSDWNGEVVAEAKLDQLESFFGLHYPASDIPAQARRLYTINWLRFISDVGYRPVPLCARQAAGAPPLDMSFCVLRSVSPIHLEYLRNMGVTASMSISLLREGQLWGLIACHHYSGPKVVPYAVRESCEFFGRALSWHIESRHGREVAERGLAVKEVESELIHAMNAAQDYRDGLATTSLLRLTSAAGAAVLIEGELRTIGHTPPNDEIRRLVGFLRDEWPDELFATDHLGSRYPAGAALERTASGLLSVALSREQGDFVLWFRPAVEHEVHWAGEPKKELRERAGVPRLSPRGSFALWKETVRGRSERWQDWERAAAGNLRLAVLQSVRRRAAELRESNQRLIAADRSKDMFLASVSHELRTPLQAILGWVQRIQVGKLDSAKTIKALQIIERNAQIQKQLVDDLLDVARMVEGKLTIDAIEVDWAQVVENAIDSVSLSVEAGNIALLSHEMAHCRVLGDPSRLQQVAWNLLTNAFKFTPKGGRVDVSLRCLGQTAELSVTDSGQGLSKDALAHLFEPFWQVEQGSRQAQKGLGLGLAITRHIVELHGGTIGVESEGLGRGSTFRVTLPLATA